MAGLDGLDGPVEERGPALHAKQALAVGGAHGSDKTAGAGGCRAAGLRAQASLLQETGQAD
jgi:hypothetical protein